MGRLLAALTRYGGPSCVHQRPLSEDVMSLEQVMRLRTLPSVGTGEKETVWICSE